MVEREKISELSLEHLIRPSTCYISYIYNNFGFSYGYSIAESLYKHSLATLEKTLGPKHTAVAFVLYILAELYTTNPHFFEYQAIELCQRYLEILENALEPDHIAVAASLNNLAEAYKGQYDYSQAELLYQRSLDIWKKTHCQEHLDVATILNNLGNLHTAQGNYSQALSLYQQSLKITEKLLGPMHLNVGIIHHNITEFYIRRKDGERPSFLSDCLIMVEHYKYAKTILDDIPYGDLGFYSILAIPRAHTLLIILEKILGPEHPNVTLCLDHIGKLYELESYYSKGNIIKSVHKSELWYQRSLNIREKSLGTHPDVAISLNYLAKLYADHGDYDKAVSFFKRSCGLYNKLYKEEFPIGEIKITPANYWYERAVETEIIIANLKEREERAEEKRKAIESKNQELEAINKELKTTIEQLRIAEDEKRKAEEEKRKAVEAKNQELELQIEETKKAYKIAHEKEKEMLSFFTHTMRNALATAPESLRQAIRLLGSEDYEKNKKQYKAINKIAALFSTLSLTDCLIDTFKQSINDPQEFKLSWQNDNTGDATPKWVIASALRQSLNRIIFMSDTSQLEKLLNVTATAAIVSMRKSFIESVLPLNVDHQGINTFYDWLNSINTIEISIKETNHLNFGVNQVKFSLLFAITSELILNALKYWDGTGNIQISWQLIDENYIFTVKNPCHENASSNLAGTHKGIAFIKRLMVLLGEQAQFNCSVEEQLFVAELKLHQSLFGA